MLKTLALTFAVLITGVATAAEPPPAATVEVLSAEFGVFDASVAGELAFQPTLEVPHTVGQRYGWIIQLRTNRRSVEVIEEYVLADTKAATPSADPVQESLAVPSQRRNQVSQRQLVPVDGQIYGEWGIGPKEPLGVRQLQVKVEGKVAATFRYEVK